MTLSLGQIQHLIRLQATAEGLLGSVRAFTGRQGNQPLRAASKQIEALIENVREVLAEADPALAEQFDREVAGQSEGFMGADARASALVGWLKGVTTAEQLEAQMRANAEAYAEAKVKEERGVGFRAS
jgi:hypothetical protein